MEGEDIALDEIRDDPTYDDTQQDRRENLEAWVADDNDDNDMLTAETQLGGGTTDVTPVDPLTLSQQGQLKQTAIDAVYKKWGIPEGGVDPNNFVYTKENGLSLKGYPEIRLTNIRTKEGLALSTIAGNREGTAIIREELGFTDYVRKQTINAANRRALQKGGDNMGDISAEVETVEMRDLGATAGKASSIVETMETTLSDAPLPLREIRGLDKALQTIRGELVNNLAKLTEIDNHITREQNKLDDPDIVEFERQRITERIRNLKDERTPRLEAASASREALRSQISRIRETINRLINEDTTLAERIRTLFREQGITIVSILTALGMVISTLVLAISGGSAAVVPTPPSKGGLREWVKKYLHALGRVLAKLAAKAGAALPGIIGSVVGWLLNLLSKTAGWLASNLWALMLAVGSILLITAREWLAKR